MVMSQQERNKRRAMIVRRWAAYRVGRAQREIWKRRRASAGHDDDDDETADARGHDPLADLPDSLLG